MLPAPHLRLKACALATLLLPAVVSAQQASAPKVAQDPLSSPNGVPHLAGESANALLIALAPAVQTELKLNDAQKSKIQRLAKSAAQQSQGLAAGADPNVAGDPRAETDRALARILDRRQAARLRQIMLQAEGPGAITRPEVAEKLNFDPVQVATIQTLMTQWQQSQNQVLEMTRANGALAAEPNPDEFAKLRLASSRLRKRAAEQINQILDRRQKATLDRILGPAFDLGKLNGQPGNSADSTKPGATADSNTKDQPATKAKPDETPNAKSDNAKSKSDTPKKRRGRRSTTKNTP